MTKQKTRKGQVLYDINPFMSAATVHVTTRRVTNKKGDMMIVSQDGGEIIAPVAGFWQSQEVDSTQFVKLYVNGVKALTDLTRAGTKVFEVLYLEVQKNIGHDRIYMSFGLVDQSLNAMSEATYGRGMRELIAKDFIAPTAQIGWFWLNPDYLWNGDRLAFVKQYWKVPSPV